MSDGNSTNGKAGTLPGTFVQGFDPRRNITKPGPGRHRDAVKAAYLKAGAKRIKVLEQIADGKLVETVKRVGAMGQPIEVEISADASQRIKAVDVLMKYGVHSDPASAVQITTEGPTAVFLGLPDLPEG